MSRRRRRRLSELPRRRLRRESDGSLFDVDERRRIELAELCDDVRSGRYFRAVRHSSGTDCTQEVLAQVVSAGVPKPALAGHGFSSAVSSLLGGLLSGPRPARGDRDGHHDQRPAAPDHRRAAPDHRRAAPDHRRAAPDHRRAARSTGRHEWWGGN